MSRIRWTLGAVDQLTGIVQHIRRDNPEAPRQVAQTITDTIGKLDVFPGIGRPGEVSGTRELVSPPYVIVYRIIKDVAEILHVWHGAQDWR